MVLHQQPSSHQPTPISSTTFTMFHQLQHLHRRSRRGSASSCSSDENAQSPATNTPFDFSRRQSSACCSERTCESLTADRTRDLWKCMLELQGQYGCYHSARIDVAMEAGDEGVNYMPNRFIIDTLNDSVIDFLPEEGWEKLNEYLSNTDASKEEK